MKKFHVLSLFALFLFSLGLFSIDVSADTASFISSTTPKITKVEDITVYTGDYEFAYTNVSPTGSIMKLEIPEDGYVRIRTYAIDFKQRSGTSPAMDAPITTRLYRDTHFIDKVGDEVTASGEMVSDTSNIAVDKGTYYIGLIPPRISPGTDTTYFGSVGVAVFYQECPSQEQFQPSTPLSRNRIEFNQEFTGFMSDANPVDYYEFKLKNKALVKFSYRTNTTGSTTFTLFNNSDETLATQTYSGGYVWYNIEKYLEPGTYYCSFASSSRGQTGFKLTKTDYNLTLKYSLPYISVTTIDDIKEIRYVRGKLTNSELYSSKWYQGVALENGVKKFGVNKVGYYTVRVTDTYDNMFMKSIYIKKADTKKPAAVKVTSRKGSNGYIKGKAEKNSTVYAYIDGNSYSQISTKASKKGVFKLSFGYSLYPGTKICVYAVDAAGNKGKVSKVVMK